MSDVNEGPMVVIPGDFYLARKVVRKRIEVVQINPPIEIEVAGDDDHWAHH